MSTIWSKWNKAQFVQYNEILFVSHRNEVVNLDIDFDQELDQILFLIKAKYPD